MNTEMISRNALNLWRLMNDGTTWCYDKLRQATHMSDRDINAALGWLAREDTLEIISDPLSHKDSFRVRHFWDLDGF